MNDLVFSQAWLDQAVVVPQVCIPMPSAWPCKIP